MKPSKVSFWLGWVFSGIPILMMGAGGTFFYFFHFDQMKKDMAKYGYPPQALQYIVMAEIGCAVIYAFPPTATLGAILMTGYLGGAVATHVHAGEPVWPAPIVFGVLAWLGLFLRDPRLRALVPFRRRLR
jgi:hypothetical protein